MSDDPLRLAARGTPALPARLEPWMRELLGDPQTCRDLIAEHGSPVNVHNFGPLESNARELVEAGQAHGVDLRIFVARKANKTLALVETTKSLGHGIDVGSERELLQVLDQGIPPEKIILTAAVKSERLLDHALREGVPVALDNLDEAVLTDHIAAEQGRSPQVVLRLAPEPVNGIAPTRFGESAATWLTHMDENQAGQEKRRIQGVHFHLHGYRAQDRVTALGQALELVDELHARGQAPSFIDIGGGVPMSYIDDQAAWAEFWRRHEAAVMGQAEALTWRGDGLGLRREAGPAGDRLAGVRDVYPYFQDLTRGAWLEEILRSEVHPGVTVAEALTSRGLRLHCEPGRAMLDGCGVTLARVAFRKHTSDGIPLVGLEMNRTQCRSTSADFLVDPLVVRTRCTGSEPSQSPRDADHAPASARLASESAFLVGAYCIEAELLLRRRFEFPLGIETGDIVAFPNTAGYMMHILESASHQIPLAANVAWDGRLFLRDGIDDA